MDHLDADYSVDEVVKPEAPWSLDEIFEDLQKSVASCVQTARRRAEACAAEEAKCRAEKEEEHQRAVEGLKRKVSDLEETARSLAEEQGTLDGERARQVAEVVHKYVDLVGNMGCMAKQLYGARASLNRLAQSFGIEPVAKRSRGSDE
jgi:hypothetical protein